VNDIFEQLERKSFQSFWGDGLLDTMVGFGLVAIGASWWQDVAVLGALFPAVAASMWNPLRKRLVEPRLGYVEFSGKRELKTRSFRHGMMTFMLGTMLLGVSIYFFWNKTALPELGEWIAGFPALLLAMMAVPFGIFTGCKRFFAYAALMLLVGTATVFLDVRPGPPILAGGIVISIAGLTILTRFIMTHPVDTGVVE
jgi:hypothetical protein